MTDQIRPPIKVLNIVSSLGFGGIERFLLRVISHLDRSLWQMDVLCKKSLSGGLLPEYEKLNVRLIECAQSYFNPVSWWWLFRIMKSNQYDVVCDFTGDIAGISMMLARAAGVPKRIAWYRIARPEYKPGIRSFYAYLVRSLVKWCATDILANARANLDAYHPRRDPTDRRYEIIDNGVPAEAFSPDLFTRELVRERLGLNGKVHVVGHVGGFRRPKNHETIVKTAAIVCQQRRDVLFLLIGDGELRPQIEAQIEAAGLSDHFLLVGNRDDVPDLLQAMDVFFFPSHSEGMPNALIEAMLTGLPFVTSNAPAILETMPESTHQWTADPTNHHAMAERLLVRLEPPHMDQEDQVRRWAMDRYSMNRMLHRYLARMAPV